MIFETKLLSDFFDRATEKEGLDKPVAVFHARVVVDVLQEAVSARGIDNLRSQLPDEWDPLFEQGAEGTRISADHHSILNIKSPSSLGDF